MTTGGMVEATSERAGGPSSPSGNGATRRDASALAVLPSAVALGLLALALSSNGAFAVRHWAPLGVVVLALFVSSPLRRVRGAPLAALAALWGFAAWTGLSLLWSDAPGTAVEGAARALLYAGLFATPLLTLPDRRSARRFAGLAATGLGAVVLVTFALVCIRGDALFLAGRLDAPIGYRNGTAVLFVMAFWPLLCVAASRAGGPGVRAAAFATASIALSLAFLTQSRGALIAFLAGGAAVLLLGPDRLRRAWLAVVAVCLLALFSGRLLEPYDAFLAEAPAGGAVGDAALGVAWIAAVAGIVMLFAAVFDRGVRGSHESRRRLRAGAAGALAVATAAAVAGALVVAGDPVDYVRERVDEFRSVDAPAPGETRLGSTGGQRSDLWRIAAATFGDHPLAGAGEGGYVFRYYRERRTDRNLNDPHSLPLRVLSELGLVGALLLGAFLVAVAVALARRTTPDDRRWAAAPAGAGAAFFGQASVDWLWLIPGVAGVAMLLLGLALALARPGDSGPRAAAASPWRGRLALRAASVLAALALTAFYVADYEVREARAAESAQERLDAARRAARLNPFALRPLLLQAGALEELGRRDGARRALRDALELESSFVVMALAGDLELRAGREAAARRWYRRALALNRRDVGLRRLAAGGGG